MILRRQKVEVVEKSGGVLSYFFSFFPPLDRSVLSPNLTILKAKKFVANIFLICCFLEQVSDSIAKHSKSVSCSDTYALLPIFLQTALSQSSAVKLSCHP